MNSNYIFWPVLAQVLLTLIMFFVLGMRKAKAVKAGELNRQEAALDNITNQFEAPVLFFILCLVIYSINAVGLLAIILAWLFTLSRYVHAYVHIGSNHVPTRLRLFSIGCLVLIAMLVLVAWKLATGVVIA